MNLVWGYPLKQVLTPNGASSKASGSTFSPDQVNEGAAKLPHTFAGRATPYNPFALQFKSPRQPMLWAAVAYCSGIIAGTYLWRPALWWAVSGAALTLAALYFAHRRPRLGWPLAFGALFLAGAIHIQLRSEAPRLDTAILPYSDGQPLKITAHVIRDGRIQPTGVREIRQTLDIETEQITTASGETFPVHSRVRLAVYGQVESQDGCPTSGRFCQKWGFSADTFHYGDRLHVLAKLKLPRNFRNPGAFDYQGYLADLGIAALGSAKAENVQLLPGFIGTRIGRWRSRMHNSIVARIHQIWPLREAVLLDAMVIGEQAFIDRDARADFQRSGAYHVLVVSGMNISILAFVVFWALRRLRFPDIPATLLTIGFCAAYAFVTEIGAPVWRATLMCAVYLATRLLYRERAMTNAAGAAALALLVYDPRQLFTASFQMTFLCVLIVAAIAIPILQRTSQLYKKALLHWDSPTYAALLPPRVAQFRLDLQLISARLASFIGKAWSRRLLCSCVRTVLALWEVFFVSAVMQMGLALPMAWYFHRATTIGLPANLTVVPLMQILMPAAVAALAISSISSLLARLPALIAALALEGITGTIHGLGGLRLADLRVPMPSVPATALAAASFILAVYAARRRLRLAVFGIAALFITSLVLAFIPASPRVRAGVLEVTSIDSR